MERLAIEGGEPVTRTPWPPWPVYEADEIEAVSRTLASGKVNYWTGETCRRFESAYAQFLGRRHAIALANGTVALELALHAFGIGPGDEVVVPSRTFIATASCAVARGARPVVADIDPVSQNITAETIEAVLTPRTKAVIPVHLAGWPCDMESIMALAARYDLIVIEDCAQAHGATLYGKPVGSFGHAAAFSFCQDKIISTGGEGGLLVLDDDEAWKRAWAYKDHGKSYDVVHRRDHSPGFRWVHESFGTNWRMTEMQAAIGRLQLRKLERWVNARRSNADSLREQLSDIPALRVPAPPEGVGHAYYKFYAFFDPEALHDGWNQSRLIEAINAEGVPCFAGSCSEIYRERAFIDMGWGQQPLPNARRLGETSLMFLVHPTLGEEHMKLTAQAVRKVFAVAAR